MSALRNQLRDRDAAYLMALLKNGDSDDPLVRAAYAELSGRGALPEYAEGMFDVTSPGPGDVPDPLESSVTPIAEDPGLQTRARGMPVTPAEIPAYAGYGQRPMGPRLRSGNERRPVIPFTSQQEADEYYTRPVNPQTGDISPSQADIDDRELGWLPVYAEDGGVTRRRAYSDDGMSPDAAFANAEARDADLRRRIPGPDGKPSDNPYYERALLPGPLGASMDVLVPTQAARQYSAKQQAARTVQRQQNDHLRRMVAAQRELNPNATPDQIHALVGDVPATQQERYAAQMRARAMQQGMREARMREEREFAGGSQNINMGNAGAIRALVQMRREDPETYRKMQAEHMRPRNVQYRFNPRTGQVEMTSQVSYEPPAQGEDGRAVMAMMQRTMQQEMLAREREEKKIPIRATANGMARGGLWGRPHTREEARNKLIDAKVGDVTLIDEVLNEIYGPAANVPPAPPTARPPGVAPVGPDMDSDSAPLPATTW